MGCMRGYMLFGSCKSQAKPVSGFHQGLAKNIEVSLGTFGGIYTGLVVVVGCGGRIVDRVVCVQTLYSYCNIIIQRIEIEHNFY